LLATEFEGQHRVGSGSFFDVFRATHAHSGLVYALKRSKREFHSKRERAEYLREVQTVSQLDLHPNIITYHRAWQVPIRIALITLIIPLVSVIPCVTLITFRAFIILST
jgi:serine/threonine protein kinase